MYCHGGACLTGGHLKEFTDGESNLTALLQRAMEMEGVDRETLHQLVLLLMKVPPLFTFCCSYIRAYPFIFYNALLNFYYVNPSRLSLSLWLSDLDHLFVFACRTKLMQWCCLSGNRFIFIQSTRCQCVAHYSAKLHGWILVIFDIKMENTFKNLFHVPLLRNLHFFLTVLIFVRQGHSVDANLKQSVV